MPIQLGVFPNHSELFRELYRFYDLNRPIAFGLLSTVFIIRATMLVASGSGAREYGELFRDLLFTAIALVGFTSFLTLIGDIPDYLIQQLSKYNVVEPKPVESDWAKYFVDGLMTVTDALALVVTLLVGLVYAILMGIACMLGPFIVLLSIMGRQRWIINTLITALVLTSLWPVLWYLLNLFMHYVMTNASWFQSTCVFALGTIAKVGIPVALIKSLARVSGATGVATGTKLVVDQSARQTLQAGRLAANTTAFLGGGHYVQGISRGFTATSNFAKSKTSSVAGQLIPTLEKVGVNTVGAIGKRLSSLTPEPVRAKVSKAAVETKAVSSKIIQGLKGYNYEAYSLGSTMPNQAVGTKVKSASAIRSSSTYSHNKPPQEQGRSGSLMNQHQVQSPKLNNEVARSKPTAKPVLKVNKKEQKGEHLV
jgi:hypothetical protein